MSLLWFWVALASGGFQTFRFALQRSLGNTGLSAGGATFARFLFGAPFAVIALFALLIATSTPLPTLPFGFWFAAMAGGLAQIAGTMATVALFKARNFAVGVAFTKSETLMVALFSAVILGEVISGAGLLALLIGVVGVLALSWQGTGTLRLMNRATGLGLTAGALFGLAAIGYRGATLQIAHDSALVRAFVTLAVATIWQTLAMLAYLRAFDPGEITRVLARWRTTGLVGLAGVMGSAGWFIAFALQNAALVRAVGQVELIYSALVSWLMFRERITGREFLGMVLLVISILVLILVA